MRKTRHREACWSNKNWNIKYILVWWNTRKYRNFASDIRFYLFHLHTIYDNKCFNQYSIGCFMLSLKCTIRKLWNALDNQIIGYKINLWTTDFICFAISVCRYLFLFISTLWGQILQMIVLYSPNEILKQCM